MQSLALRIYSRVACEYEKVAVHYESICVLLIWRDIHTIGDMLIIVSGWRCSLRCQDLSLENVDVAPSNWFTARVLSSTATLFHFGSCIVFELERVIADMHQDQTTRIT